MLEWTEENSEKLVVLCMSALGKFVPAALHSECMEKAHAAAEETCASKQEEYALRFAKKLYTSLLERAGADVLTAWMEARSRHQEAIDKSVATEKVPASAKAPVLAAAPKMSVEDWEKSGLRFRPVAARGVAALFARPEPSKRGSPMAHAASRENLALAAEDAPWGSNAGRVAEWAWRLCNNGQKPSVLQRGNIAQVLSALYYAGFLKEGSIIPVGYGHKARVAGRKKG